MFESDAKLVSIIEGITDVKGQNIVGIDMSNMVERPCDYFVICEGNSTTQVGAIADSVSEKVREETGERPYAQVGMDNCEWVAYDYGNVMVHIFLPETRAFYDLEHLWEDGKVVKISEE